MSELNYNFKTHYLIFKELPTNNTIWRDDHMRTKKLIVKRGEIYRLPIREDNTNIRDEYSPIALDTGCPPCEVYYPEGSHICDQHAVIFEWDDDKPLLIQRMQRITGCVFFHNVGNFINYNKDNWSCEHMVLPTKGITQAFNNTSLNESLRIEFLNEIVKDHVDHKEGGYDHDD